MGGKPRLTSGKPGTAPLLQAYFESEFFAALPKTKPGPENAVERIEDLYGVTLS